MSVPNANINTDKTHCTGTLPVINSGSENSENSTANNIKIDFSSDKLYKIISAASSSSVEIPKEQTKEEVKYNLLETNIDLITKITGMTKESLLKAENAKLALEIEKCLQKLQAKNIKLEEAEETIKKYITAIALGWSSDEFDAVKNNSSKENIKTVEDAIMQIAKTKNKDFDIKTAPREELKSYVLEYFNTKLENYRKQTSCEKDAQDLLKKEFGLLLANTSDKDKDLLLSVAIDIINDAQALYILFKSCDDRTVAQNMANGVEYEKLKDIDDTKRRIIISNFSKEFVEKNLDLFNEDFKKFYEANKNALEELFTKTPEEQEKDPLYAEYIAKLQISADFSAGIALNKNLDENERKQKLQEIDTFAKEHVGYEQYIRIIANIYNDPNNCLNISKEEFKELFDTITNNEFSKAVENSAPSAIDSETGNFKTVPSEVISEKKEAVNSLVQDILNNNQEHELKTFEIINNCKEDTKVVLTTVESVNYSISEIIDIISGKKSDTTRNEEDNAIKSYKLLNTAIQGNVLRSSSGKFFNRLLENTKTFALKLLIATGWKGNSFAETKKVEETIKEREEKEKKSA